MVTYQCIFYINLRMNRCLCYLIILRQWMKCEDDYEHEWFSLSLVHIDHSTFLIKYEKVLDIILY
jgi:hypothetical protein